MTGENPLREDESAVSGVLCFIGIGSNLDRPLERCREAVRRLAETDGIGFLRRASYYKSEPAGLSDQPWFVNTVAEVRTPLPPRELLARLQEIEAAMGRAPGPRGGRRMPPVRPCPPATTAAIARLIRSDFCVSPR